jgi:hypothetical protein
LLPASVFGQRMGFVTSTPRIDSFPEVRLKMTATYNGTLPQPGIAPNNLVVTEDKGPVGNLQLTDCDESGQAAIVFCADVSTSILSSAGDTWNIYPSYFNAYAKFITGIPSASKYALVCFTNAPLYFPGAGNGFYAGQNSADSSAFINNLRNQPFKGFTDVDSAIHFSSGLLQYQPFKQKAIVLVTDDAIINTPYYDSLLNVLGITLYVMEIGYDGAPINSLLTHSTGGIYVHATDTAQYSPTMQQVEELVFGEHCMIHYLSVNPCPWEKMHDISLTLNYKALSSNIIEQYVLGRTIFDHAPPVLSIDTPVYITRIVKATKNFPCTMGIRDFSDSSYTNFSLLSIFRSFPNLVYDSLIVIDSMQPAKAVYFAEDSAYHSGREVVLYNPKPDTLAPEITPTQAFGGKYQLLITETRPWDMGIKTMQLQAGAQNVVLDSFTIISRRVGEAWLHRVDPSAASSACFAAIDSAGNAGTYCIRSDSLTGDTLPPVIIQDPIVSPRLQITGVVTEEQPKDIGIKTITIRPAANAGAPSVTFLSQHRATFRVPILDSLQPVREPISASDSVGNAAQDTLRYDPEPDMNPPSCSVESPDAMTRIFHATELSPWDRGIAKVIIVGSATNLNVGPVIYTSVYQAQQKFTVIDPFSPANAVIQAFDSAGHDCETTISIASIAKPLIPFTATNLVDFGTVYAPAALTKTLQITNPNESPVVVTKINQTGDVSVFGSDMTNPFVFQSKETKTFTITYTPTLLGNWRSDWTISNDTMKLVSFAAIGSSIGAVQITLDTVNVANTQQAGSFTVAISAVPAPINLDTISFILDYDADMVQLQNPVNHIGNYTIASPAALPYGKMQYQLTRIDKSLNSTLSFGTSTFDVPFSCSVAKHDTSLLLLENIFIGQRSTASYSPGMITVGSQCGDQTLRSYLNGVSPFIIKSVVPNPANGMVSISIISQEKNESVLAIVNNLGETTMREHIFCESGESQHSLDLSRLASGSYQLILSSGGGHIESRLIQIIH